MHKTNRILREFEEAHGWPKERGNQSYDALRGVLHALRDRLTVRGAARLAAQLPVRVRGICQPVGYPTPAARVPGSQEPELTSCEAG